MGPREVSPRQGGMGMGRFVMVESVKRQGVRRDRPELSPWAKPREEGGEPRREGGPGGRTHFGGHKAGDVKG